MKHNILIVFAAILIVGCCPQKIIHTSAQDSVRVEIVERVERFTDTVTVVIPAERDSVIVHKDSVSFLENSVAESVAAVQGGKLSHSLKTKPQPIYKPVEIEVQVRDSIVYKERIVTNTIEVERDFKWYESIALNSFIPLLILVIAMLFLIIRR